MLPTPWPAPAKLNLFLHITGQRDDGYHYLQTVFQLLDYGDWLWFTPIKSPDILRDGDVPGVTPEQDLLVQAAHLLKDKTAYSGGVNIKIDKRLPMGAGIGGGSSDAATVLVALNSIWETGLGLEELASLGGALGADVPVFVKGKSAWAEGTGDIITPIELHQCWSLVISPEVQVSTAKIFSSTQLTRDSRPRKIASFLESRYASCSQERKELDSNEFRNDCTAVVTKLYPEVQQVIDWLGQYAQAKMTGTGASVFALFETQPQARDVLANLPDKWRGFVAKTVNQSPLLARLQQQG